MSILAETRRVIGNAGEALTHRGAKLGEARRILEGGITQTDRDHLRDKIMIDAALANMPQTALSDTSVVSAYDPDLLDYVMHSSDGIPDEKLDAMLKEDAIKTLEKRSKAK